MAVLSKIREKSIFLIIVIAMALFAFVLGDLFKYRSSSNLIGEVEDEPITREQFAKEVDMYKAQMGNRISQTQAAKNVWKNLIKEKIYNIQLKNAGIVVGEEDVWNAIINMPYIKNSPSFKNEAGLFDEEKFKEFLANLKDNAENNPNDTQWASWLRTEKSIKANLEQQIYTDLVKNGINTTLVEGEDFYKDQLTKSDIDYVYVPFRNIPDSLFNISNSEVLSYEKKHKRKFSVEATRDLVYVKFDITPTKGDEEIIKKEVATLINDKEEYSSAAKTTIKIKGFKNTTDYKAFFAENNSDLPYSEDLLIKVKLPILMADSILAAKKGDVIGPYKDKGYIKLSKVLNFKRIPDSVRASHILISYKGAFRSTDPKTEAQAKKMADSIYKLVRKNKRKFAEIAKKLSYDKTSGAKGGDLNWFVYSSMIPVFRDFVFLNKTGKVGIVKSRFGYHIIRIDGQKHFKKAVKLVTFGRKIEASEDTENDVFEKAETFTSDVLKRANLKEVAKENNYVVRPATGIKVMSETISGLKNQRSIVNWAFKKDTKVGDIKRFDTDNGYVVVQLAAAHKKGLMSLTRASISIRRTLYNKRKEEYIKKAMADKSLEEIAKKFKLQVKSSLAVSLASPVLPGIGRSPGVIGAINVSNKGDLLRSVEGRMGIFAVKINKKELPIELPNYLSYKNQLYSKLQLNAFKMYEALEKEAEIVDNRYLYY